MLSQASKAVGWSKSLCLCKILLSTRTTIFLSFDSCKIIRDYKSMEIDCLLLQIFWETLSECCFGAKADGMAALPFLVPAEGHFKLRILAEFLCL